MFTYHYQKLVFIAAVLIAYSLPEQLHGDIILLPDGATSNGSGGGWHVWSNEELSLLNFDYGTGFGEFHATETLQLSGTTGTLTVDHHYLTDTDGVYFSGGAAFDAASPIDEINGGAYLAVDFEVTTTQQFALGLTVSRTGLPIKGVLGESEGIFTVQITNENGGVAPAKIDLSTDGSEFILFTLEPGIYNFFATMNKAVQIPFDGPASLEFDAFFIPEPATGLSCLLLLSFAYYHRRR